MFVRSQAVFLHTQSQTAPTFPGDKEEDVVMRLTINLPGIYRGGNGKKRRQKSARRLTEGRGKKGAGEGKCPSLNTTRLSHFGSHNAMLQKFNNGNKQILNYWSYNQLLLSSPIRFLEAFSSDNRKMKFKKQNQNEVW